MKISLIAAVGKNNEIGKGNDLVFKLPADMKHFKDITTGHIVIMGRKTYESIGKPLPNRKNIIVTRDKKYKSYGVDVVYSLEEAIKLAKINPNPSLALPLSGAGENTEIFIIGGGEIYKEVMKFVDKIYLTEINATDKKADTFFPEIIPVVFGETKREHHKKDEKNLYDYDFVEYERF
ncbi:MAG: Dihydrofolate reductase [Candidatus Nomurabacteria bacterium GW2011_GWA2_40_9]|uniref:Dihydrofolate reductase n=1 Tax=Candidatus Nomurabacteria bacterium GW2011_GWA2_40_9 TaxID=1618734 RepID=A0A0G0WU05_9BACT|nr:MAG: Dihydrofolate reductase [Candidatus Nomurabacteria bacterium GW2011_GWA2_40_9]